ncbi:MULTISPECIES: TDP-N-acetylfucosamine:lipid II N-acetylfucosaminyltransferase [unclassified Mannheimia]|uniref:TDP-N-acetylfucosamine:lipid II N-acetylfucosaminyltransferase n=1 Tax=unclassified Mannheimia TaxID=2645054 RepID=UPI00359E0781
MKPIYHILGSDIPHHNQRVLTFFQQELLPTLPVSSHYFYVMGESAIKSKFSHLEIATFTSQQAIVKAIIAKNQQNPTACFLLHGQFNVWIWLAIGLGKLSTENIIWHIWGADLYEVSTAWKFRLFYPIRRFAQRKLKQIWATKGDLDYFWRKIRKRSEKDQVIYFPTKLPDQHRVQTIKNDRLTILLGNSGDPSNNHIPALKEIYKGLGEDIRIIIPMGYPANNEHYIQQIETESKRLFLAENLQILRDKLDFDAYLALLAECDLGYFNFERQQGIGTICLLIQQHIPCVLHPNNPFCLDMQAENVPYLLAENLTYSHIQATKQQLENIDKNNIAFFPQTYLKLWQTHLTELIHNE